ncbi:Uncharacterised protein [uncultured archaeon]|nr:Uncharacterised protein [uncultured archaeon]
MIEDKQVYKCPFCESKITKEQFDQVIQENELLKKKAQELQETIKKLESEKAKLKEKIKEAVEIEKKKAQKLIDENKKLKQEKAKFEEQIKEVRKKEREKYGEKLERDSRLIEKLKEENELLKKGLSPQDAGFDFENNMQAWLEKKFDKDKVEKTGKKGDSLLRIMNKGKEIGMILIECKKKATHQKSDIEEVKRHKIDAKADVGVLITNGYFGKKKMDGFCNIEGILVIRPYSALEFIELLRKQIVEIDSLKISDEEKNKELTKLWKFIHSQEFESQMNSILRDVNLLKELDDKEGDILKKRGKIEENILKAHKIISEEIDKTRKTTN